jgi:hypothetical protein
MMASNFSTFFRSIWYLKSGPASINMTWSLVSMSTDERSRLSFKFTDLHTSQGHATTGTPCDVPEPKNVTLIKGSCFNCCKGMMFAFQAVIFLLFLQP